MKYSIVADKFIEGATAHIKTLAPGAPLKLVREPENQYDKNAVAIYAGDRKIGYVPKKQNAALTEFIRQSEKVLLPDASVELALDDATTPPENVLALTGIRATFTPSPNSGFPQVEVL